VEILRVLQRNENVVEFIDAYEDAMNVYIIMELCAGGDLSDRILDAGGRCSEESAVPLVWQILSAVAYMHRRGVIHRDIKPENFLFASEDKNSILRPSTLASPTTAEKGTSSVTSWGALTSSRRRY
jgi:serine/threonine protein kinase